MIEIESLKKELVRERDSKNFEKNLGLLSDIYVENNNNIICEFIIKLHNKSKTQKHKITCLYNIGKFSHINESSEPIIKNLKSNRSELIIQTLKTLNSFNDFNDEKFLIEKLHSTKNNEIKVQIIKNLAKIGKEKSIKEIQTLFKKSRDLSIRLTAFNSLKILNEKYNSEEIENFIKTQNNKWYKNFKEITLNKLLETINNFLKEKRDLNNIYLEFPLEDNFIGYSQVYIKELKNNSWWSIEYGIKNNYIDYFNDFINPYPIINKQIVFKGLNYKENINTVEKTINTFYDNKLYKLLETWRNPHKEDIEKLNSELNLTNFEEKSIKIGFLKTNIRENSEFVKHVFELVKNERKLNNTIKYVNSKR